MIIVIFFWGSHVSFFCFTSLNYILHTLNVVLSICWMQLFESSALMNVTAVKSLLSALHQLSCQHIPGNSQLSGQQIGSIAFSVERMTSILVNNLHRGFPS
jgi:hypothetical protein